MGYSYPTDTIGRPTGITASPLNQGDDFRQVVKDVLYGPAGELQQMRVLQDPAPGSVSAYLKQTFTYNTLFQMTQQTAIDEESGGSTTTLLNLEYRYTEGQNNGRITQLKDWVSGEEVTYAYDNLNRLIQASTTGPEYGLNFAYDGFGNLTSQQLFKGTGYNTNLSYDGQTNRITTPGYTYDANGNLTAMPALTMQYNVQNRMTQSVHTISGTKLYAYSANGQRVAQSDPPHSNYWNNTWSIYFYGPDGSRIADCSAGYDQSRALTATCGTANIYFGGKLVRKEQKPVHQEDGLYVYPPGTTLASDRLGSTRYAGGTTTSYYPYGEERTPTANDTQKFATYTRDSATGLDYANARYYSPQIARFTTADPYQASGGPSNPQSWNRYAYVQNDPVNLLDPSGRQAQSPSNPVYCPAEFSAAECLAGRAAGMGGEATSGGGSAGACIIVPGGELKNGEYQPPLVICFPISGTPAPPPPECEIQVKYRGVTGIEWSGQTHAYLWVNDGSRQFVMEGTPQFNPPKIAVFPPGPNWGNLTGLNSRDGMKGDNPGSSTSAGDAKWGPTLRGTWVCDAVNRMVDALNSYNTHPVHYWAIPGPNSNSFASWLLQQGGVSSYFPIESRII